MAKKTLFLLIPIFCFLHCSSNKDTTNTETIIKGQLFVVGNEPFIKLVVNDIDNIMYEIKGDSTIYKELWSLQNKYVLITGKVLKTPLGNSIIASSYKEQKGK